MPDPGMTSAPVIDPRYPLLERYLYRFGEVAHLFDYSPHEQGSYAARCEELRTFEGDRRALSRVLEDYNRSLGAPAETLKGAAALADPRSVVVISAQQPGVLTGPLYTFWKAAAALQLAEAVSSLLGPDVPVVCVFWVGAEDHDLAEVAPVDILTPGGELARCVYDPGPGYPARTSVGFLPAGEAALAVVDEVDLLLSGAQFRPEVARVLRETAGRSQSLGDWFGRLMLFLFGRRGLVLANPLLPGLRVLVGPVLRRMLAENAAVAAAFGAGREKVKALGLEPQVQKDPAAANLYLYRGTERVPLYREGPGRFRAGPEAGAEVLDEKELLEEAARRPERFSPNVVLRPVAQDALFPVLAHVAGPGETSYFALYRDLYHHFGRSMPIIYPRPAVTIIEPAVARHLRWCGLDPAAALEPGRLEKAKAAYLEEEDPVGIETLFGRLSGVVREAYLGERGVAAALKGIDPSLEGLAERSLERVLREMDRLRRKAWQRHRRSCREALRRFGVIEASLRPRGDYQERVLNIFPFLARYGPGLVGQLLAQPLVPPDASVDPGHRLVRL
jgi:bacillithiol biosynthesis cysteine-adding enzyme BshC